MIGTLLGLIELFSYLFIGFMIQGYYFNKYRPGDVLAILALLVWPIYLNYKILRLVFSIPRKLG